MCFFRFPFCANDLSHTSHLCGFAPVWVRRCFLRLESWLKDLLHSSHKKDFSPLCCIKSLFLRNNLSHWEHLCDLSPCLWVRKSYAKRMFPWQIRNNNWCTIAFAMFHMTWIVCWPLFFFCIIYCRSDTGQPLQSLALSPLIVMIWRGIIIIKYRYLRRNKKRERVRLEETWADLCLPVYSKNKIWNE